MSLLDDILGGLKKDAKKVYNTVQAPVTGIVGLGSEAADRVFNGGKNAQYLRQATQQQVNRNVAQSFVPQNVARGTATPLQFGSSFAKTGASLAPYAVGPGGGALTAKLGSTVAGKLGSGLLAKGAGQASRIGANAAIAAPTFAGLDAATQGINSGFRNFDANQANMAGAMGAVGSLAGDAAPIVLKGVAKGAKKGAQTAVQAVDDATRLAHDKTVDKVANSIGEAAGINHSMFEPSLVKAASPQDIKSAEKYFNQIRKGKDIGTITTTKNENGAIEPLTKDGLQKYLAYKAAYEGSTTKTTNDFGGSNFVQNKFSNVPTRQIDEATLQNGLSAYKQRSESGSVGLQRNDQLDQLTASTTKPEEKLSRFANKTMMNSDEVSPTQKKLLRDEQVSYQATTNKDRQAVAQDFLSKTNNQEAFNTLIKKAEDKSFDPKGQDKTTAIELFKKLQSEPDETSQLMATELARTISERGSNAGQEIQALSQLSKRTPAGLRLLAEKELRKAGVDVDGEIGTKLADFTKKIGGLKEGSKERDYAIGELRKYVTSNIPSSLLDKASSVWTAGLLSGVKTITGAPTSNIATALLKAPADAIAAAADFAGNGTKGIRSNTLVSPKNYIKGLGEGTKAGLKFLKTGIDERDAQTLNNLGQSQETNFGKGKLGKAVGAPVNGVFRVLSAADRPFYYGQLRQSEAELAKLDRLNKGRAGYESNPIKDAFTAESEGRQAVLDQDTLLSKIASGIRQNIDNHDSVAGRTLGKIATTANAPFVRVPSAGLARMVDFSPVGAPVNLVKQLAEKKFGSQKSFNWRDLNRAVGESATGTGVVALGYSMAVNNLVSGEYPSSDPKEQQRWRAEGISANSVKIGDKWIGLNYLGPVGSLLQQGKRFQESQASGDNVVLSSGKAELGLGRDALNQSYLQGLSNSIEAVRDPASNLKSYVNGLSGTVIPSAVNDLANATDPNQRQVNNPLEAAINRVPGARTNLNVKQDVYGNKIAQRTGPLDLTANPLRPSNALSNDVTKEVERLHNVDKNDKDLQVTPTAIQKTLSLGNGEKVTLSDQQRYDLQNKIGTSTQKNWSALIKTSDYKKLSDSDKAQALNNLRTDSAAIAQREYIASNNLAPKQKNLSNSQKNLVNGSTSLSSYAKDSSQDTSTSNSSSSLTLSSSLDSTSKSTLSKYSSLSTADRDKKFYSDPSAEYQYDLAKYKNDSANGKLSKTQDIKRQASLEKESVGSKFDKNIRELYSGLSSSQLYQYASTDPDGNNIVKKVLAYGDALSDAGVAKNKFRTSTGAVNIKAKTTGSSKKASFKAANNSVSLSAFKAAKGAKIKRSSTSLGGNKAKGLIAYKKPAKAKEFKS